MKLRNVAYEPANSGGRRVVFCLFLAGCGVFGPSAAEAQREGYKMRFAGKSVPQALAPAGTVSCESDMADSTGYYAKDGLDRLLPPAKMPDISLESDFGKQSKRAQWRISFRDKETALVVAGGSATGPGERYQVIRRDKHGIILVRVGEGAAGGTVEVLTIDPETGSFLSSDVGVGALWNRSTVWVGHCR